MLTGLLATGLRIIGLGASLAAMSEVLFYPVHLDRSLLVLCAFYGPLAYTAWLIMARTRVRTWAGAFWGACLFGFFVEGIPVPVLYEAIPFTIFWTSISWHALISATFGLWLFRVVTARRSILGQLIWMGLAGVYLGAWSVELWSVREDGSPWVWTPTEDVLVQMLAGWALFVLGHLALNGAARLSVVPWRGEVWVFGIATATLFALGMLPAVFPVSLVLPILAALSIWLMMQEGRQGTPEGASPFLVRLSTLQVPLAGIVVSLIVPLSATAVYHLLAIYDVQLESSAIHILWAGPVSIGLVGWSAARILWRSRSTP